MTRLMREIACCLFIALIATPLMLMAAGEEVMQFREPGPVEHFTLYSDGSVIELPTEMVAWPIIGSDMSNMTLDEFKNMVHAGLNDMEKNPHKVVVGGKATRGGLNITFNVTNAPPGAQEALDSVAAYLEGIFSDTCTVLININFRVLPSGILGWTLSYYVQNIPWVTTRTGLIADMDSDDSLQNWLPSGNTIPIRYTYGSSTVTNENVITFTKANYNATLGTSSGLSATIEFNTNFSWDYDPGDGLTAFCFQTVTAHEIGHCLGFVTGADITEAQTMDIYRFQNTDGAGDYNPDDLSEFQTTARLVDEDASGSLDDDANSDLIANEYRMSDGTPYQSSHFRQNADYAIMRPAQSSNETFYPHFYKYPDRDVFDVLGWSLPMGYGFTFYIHGHGSIALNPASYSFAPGTQVELTAVPDPGNLFDHWSGALTGEQNPDTVLMDGDKVVEAYFVYEYCTLTVNINGNGIVEKDPDLPAYPYESEVELTAVPDPGWYFHHWSGGLGGYQNPDTIIMNGNKTVTAHFYAQYVAENNGTGLQGSLFDVSPNPSTGKTNIRYQGFANRNIKIEIYDVSGQLVKDLSPHSVSSSVQNVISWKGEDSAGDKVPSGVYFVRFTAEPNENSGAFKETKKLLLIQ